MAFNGPNQPLYQQNSLKKLENAQSLVLQPTQENGFDSHSKFRKSNKLTLLDQEIAYYHNSNMEIKDNNNSISQNEEKEQTKAKAAQAEYEKKYLDGLPTTRILQKIEKDRIEFTKGNGSNLPLPSSPLPPPNIPLSLLNTKNVNHTNNNTFNQPYQIVVPPLSVSIIPNQQDKTILFSKERDSSAFRQWRPEVLQSQQQNRLSQKYSLNTHNYQYPLDNTYQSSGQQIYSLYSDQTRYFYGSKTIYSDFSIPEKFNLPPPPYSHEGTQDYYKLFYSKELSQSQQYYNHQYSTIPNGEQINQQNIFNRNGQEQFEAQRYMIPQSFEISPFLEKISSNQLHKLTMPSYYPPNYEYNMKEEEDNSLNVPDNIHRISLLFHNSTVTPGQIPFSSISKDLKKADLITDTSRFYTPQRTEADILVEIEAMEKFKQDNEIQYIFLEEKLKEVKLEEKQTHLAMMTKYLEKINSISLGLIKKRNQKILLESYAASTDKSPTDAAALATDVRIPQKEIISAQNNDTSKNEYLHHQAEQIKIEDDNQQNKQDNDEIECKSDSEYQSQTTDQDQQLPQSLDSQQQQQLQSEQLHYQNQELIKIEQPAQQFYKNQEQQKQEYLKKEQLEDCFDQNQNNSLPDQQPIETLPQFASVVNGQQSSSDKYPKLPLILHQAKLQMNNNNNIAIQHQAESISQYLASQVHIYQDGNTIVMRNNALSENNPTLHFPNKNINCDNHPQEVQPVLNLVSMDNQKDNNHPSQQQQEQQQQQKQQQQCSQELERQMKALKNYENLQDDIRHRKGTKEPEKLERQQELTRQELQKRMQFHNQLKIFMLQCTKFINESFKNDKSWYKDESDLKFKHMKYLKFFKNRFTKSDLSYFLQKINPITVQQLDQLLNQTQGRKQLLAQRRIIFIIIILSSFLTPAELQLILGEESKKPEFIRQSNTQLINYLINNQDKLILINEHISTVNRFNMVNRILSLQFCLFYSGKRACQKKASKLDQFYCKNYVLTMLSNPEGIE